MLGEVTELWRFPIKSMGGEAVRRLELDADGVAGDRRFAVRDVETGLIASAKRPGRWGALLTCRAETTDGGNVLVTLPDGASFIADDPALAAALGELTGRRVVVEHVDDRHPDASGDYEAEFPELEHVRLRGRMAFPTTMATDARSYVDLAAVHLMTTSTIGAVASISGSDSVTSGRFRPNVVIDTGTDAEFVEDDWAGSVLQLGFDVVLTRVTQAARCIMTSVAQPGLPRDNRILQSIAREHRVLTDDVGPMPCAGLFSEVAAAGVIAAGDTVAIAEATPAR
mgnify:CR=1 FL=1